MTRAPTPAPRSIRSNSRARPGAVLEAGPRGSQPESRSSLGSTTGASRATDRLSKRLLLVIDEAANIAPPPDLAQIASTARGVGIQLVTVWQDFAQIQAHCGTFARTVINNHRAKVILAGVSDTPTLDYISRLIGDLQTFEESRTRNADGRESITESRRHLPLASTAALRRADTGTGVLVYGNFHPAQLKLRPWFGYRY